MRVRPALTLSHLDYLLTSLRLVEMARIFRAGGYVEFGRVNGTIRCPRCVTADSEGAVCSLGNLSLARALGDFDYKKNANVAVEEQIITANPEIIEHKITDEDEFLIIACDG